MAFRADFSDFVGSSASGHVERIVDVREANALRNHEVELFRDDVSCLDGEYVE